MQVQANGLLNVIVSSLVERQAVEPEGALGCEVEKIPPKISTSFFSLLLCVSFHLCFFSYD